MGLGWGVSPQVGLDGSAEYNPIDDSWRKRASLPTPRVPGAVSAVRNKCYVIGGASSGGFVRPPALSVVEEYDPVKNTWRTRAALPEERGMAGSAVVGQKIYVVGGASRIFWDTESTAAIAIYDPFTDQWSTGADMPTPRLGLVGGRAMRESAALDVTEEYVP
ncbi:Kelch repeat-containing protein [Haliea sp. E17]|uniref:Kelch repeat-containing protein n=1 Tax=Haliea sp. E17 TaxID=3401576 RepID=UPI003AABE1B2